MHVDVWTETNCNKIIPGSSLVDTYHLLFSILKLKMANWQKWQSERHDKMNSSKGYIRFEQEITIKMLNCQNLQIYSDCTGDSWALKTASRPLGLRRLIHDDHGIISLHYFSCWPGRSNMSRSNEEVTKALNYKISNEYYNNC